MNRNDILADILKEYETINEVTVPINENKHTFYFKPMSLFEHIRIKNQAVDTVKEFGSDGSLVATKEVYNEDKYAIYTVLEKSLDKDGNRLFSLTDSEMKDALLKKFDYTKLSHIAAMMSIDLTGVIKQYEDNLKAD